MAIVAVLMDTNAEPGEKLDPALRAEIEKLAPGLEIGEVGESELADNAVTSPKIKEGAVHTEHIAEAGVEAVNIKAGAVGTAALAGDSVTGAKAGAGVVTAKDPAGNYIESEEWHGTAAQFAQINPRNPNVTYYVT
ncbi:tail fiber protein [Mycobacterium phage Imvubu]|uniref:Uncharacterized protein n=1 Tax=Mycobacterium phage Imvubu TaxID=2686233 RepID=A0A6B9LFU5_9CAUD|nr:tail fiber protein [Mycobacterium phage Imvubu]QHB37775.1 hypothetical protein PBI_IMVUBU_34 [Mycobacterium phage Imvubu]